MKSYHYLESGLDNVHLKNGYTYVDTAYGDAVQIEDIDGLHVVIGTILAGKPKILSPLEFRFLRIEMDLSIELLADLLGTQEERLAEYEKGNGAISFREEIELRMLYLKSIQKNDPLGAMIKKIVDAHNGIKESLSYDNDRWHSSSVAAA